MSSGEPARPNPLPGVLWALVGGTYTAMVAFLMIASADWSARAILSVVALIPVLLVLLLVAVWRLVHGPARWSFGVLHWLLFLSPTAALLTFVAVALASGRSLS